MDHTSDLPDPFVEDPALAAFITKVDGHWLWDEGHLDSDGYGYVYREGYMWRAHRWVWFLVHGFTELPVDHVCRNRRCVNALDPNHLEAVTTAENNRRKPVPGSCPEGHNEWVTRSNGHRRCAECHRQAERRRRAGNNPKG